MNARPTSWILANKRSGGVNGARLHPAAGAIEWVDQPGCA